MPHFCVLVLARHPTLHLDQVPIDRRHRVGHSHLRRILPPALLGADVGDRQRESQDQDCVGDDEMKLQNVRFL